MIIRTVIVEEDAAARAELAALLADEADVELIEPTRPLWRTCRGWVRRSPIWFF